MDVVNSTSFANNTQQEDGYSSFLDSMYMRCDSGELY